IFSSCLLLSIVLVNIPALTSAYAQQPSPSRGRRMARLGAVKNTQIARIVAEINAHNIELTIRKLVGFGTRNTLSDQNNPDRGIGAARDWLYGEFQKVAMQSGGRMTVEKQT